MNAESSPSGLTLATRVTILRILGVPIFILLLVYYTNGLAHGEHHDDQRIMALAVFVAVALTDALDGYLARSRGEITRLGRILDPMADKALLISGLVLLTRPSLPDLVPHIPIWLTTLVISRDVVTIGGVLIIHHVVGTVDVKPRFTGKIATVLQMITLLWVLAQAPAAHFDKVVVATGLFTLVSGLQYVLEGMRQMERASHH